MSRPAKSLIHLAERDLIRDRLPFFAVVWSAVSLLWLNALAHRVAPPFGWAGSAAILAAQLAVFGTAVRLTRRTSSPAIIRGIGLAATGLLGVIWTVAASRTDAPFDVVALVMPVLVLVPPLFFAWSWRAELALMLGLGAQAALWFGLVERTNSAVLGDIATIAGGGAVLGVALAARVAQELRLRIARREQEEVARKALDAAHEAFRGSEERFRVAFHRAPIGMCMVGADSAILQVNAAFERMLGRPAAELVGMPIDDLIMGEDLPMARTERERVLGGAVESLESVMRLRHRDGHPVWTRVTRALVRNREGEPSYMIGQAEDVTERRRAEEAQKIAEHALAVSERMFRGFAESTAAGVLIVQDEIIRYVNAAVTAITGFTSAELRGMPLGELVHPDDRAVAVARARARLHDASVPTRVEYRLRTMSGGHCWVDLTVGLVEHEGRPALLGTAFDVTERHQAEEALRASLAELRQREEQLRLLAQRQVKVREEERRRLGFDLHDDVCQELVGTGIMVESVRGRLQGIDPEASQKLARVSRHLNELGEHLRQVARELRPMLLHDLGLEDSLSSLAAGLTSTTTRVTAISTTPIPRLGEDVEVAVYRIVQEAITNGLRHADAAAIAVSLAASEGVLRVEIRDDGRGFDVRERQRDALGLVSMEERALALSGKLQVKSTPGRGTSVLLTCPLIRRVPRPAA